MSLSVGRCYAVAWKSFAKWWVPICLVSAILVVFQLVPRILMNDEIHALSVSLREFGRAAVDGHVESAAALASDARELAWALVRKLLLWSAYLFPLIALLTVVLLMVANRAVRNRKDERPAAGFLVYVAAVHVGVAILKAVAFLFFIVPGVYVYVRLLFVSLVMIEDRRGAREAIAMSWRMTAGHFWPLFVLVFLNAAIQMLLLPTVIGEIPGTGFVNTARAAAFAALRRADRPPPVPTS